MSTKKFKVGDRVRFTSQIDESLYGVEGVVSFVSAEGFVTFTPDGVSNSSGGWAPGRFELIELIEPAPKFKVGDRVSARGKGRGTVIAPDGDFFLVRYDEWALGHGGAETGAACGVPSNARNCWFEYPEDLKPEIEPAPKFKVGDRVVNNGDLGTVTMSKNGKYAVKWDEMLCTGLVPTWHEERLDFAPPVLPAVDDFVRVDGSGYGRVTGVETPAPKVMVEFGDGTPVPVDPAEVRILGKSPVAA